MSPLNSSVILESSECYLLFIHMSMSSFGLVASLFLYIFLLDIGSAYFHAFYVYLQLIIQRKSVLKVGGTCGIPTAIQTKSHS